MVWNYRILKREKAGQKIFALVECFYDEGGESFAYSEDIFTGENKKAITHQLEMMLRDVKKGKVLDEKKLKKTMKEISFEEEGLLGPYESTDAFFKDLKGDKYK